MNAQPWTSDPQSHIQVATPSGPMDAYMARPPGATIGGAVIVLHEIFGINDDMRRTCNRLAALGLLAISPDLFWRNERLLNLNRWSSEEWQHGFALYQQYDLDAGVQDIAATVAAARGQLGAGGRVGVMGFCLGGLLTFLVSARTRVEASVAFHGSRTEEFLAEATGINAPFQMHLASEDEFIPATAQEQIRTAIAALPDSSVFTYAGCHHGFSRNGGEHYVASAAELALERTSAFLRNHLSTQ